MASSDPTEITSALVGESPYATDSSAIETTPLVKDSSVRKTGLLKKLRESVVIKSKAANMILIWSALSYLVYGIGLNPEIIFVIPLRQSMQVDHPNSTSSFIPLMNMIGSGIYGLIAFWLLFYPLAGYLADVRFGRYKVVTLGLKIEWVGVLTFTLMFTIVYVLGLVLDPLDTRATLALRILNGLLFVPYIVLSIGFAAFAANIIQFGIDQLQDLPAKTSFLFIHWHLLTFYIGVGIGKFLWSTWLHSIDWFGQR